MPGPRLLHLVPCQAVRSEGADPRRVSVERVTHDLFAPADAAFPWTLERLCVFVQVMAGEAAGAAGTLLLTCVHPRTGKVVFGVPPRPVRLPAAPTGLAAACFVLRRCPFPAEGGYELRLWFQQRLLGEQPLRVLRGD